MSSVRSRSCKVFLGAFCALLLAGSLPAATIDPTSGSLNLTLFTVANDPTPIAFDLDGIVQAAVNPGSLGPIFISDAGSIGGVDPFPQTVLLGIVDIPPTQGLLFTFDGSSIALGGPGASIMASATDLGAATDPALLAILAGGPWIFEFTFNSVQEDVVFGQDAFDLYSYSFLGARSQETPAVPEPTSMLLFGSGLLVAVFVRRRQRR